MNYSVFKEITNTTEKRHEIYIDAYNIFKEGNNVCMCGCFYQLLLVRFEVKFILMQDLERFTNCLPEFLALKPKGKNISRFWWPVYDTQTRIEKFELIINQTKTI